MHDDEVRNPVIGNGASCPICRSRNTDEHRLSLARTACWYCLECNTVFSGAEGEYHFNHRQRSKAAAHKAAVERARAAIGPRRPRESPLRDAGRGDEQQDAPEASPDAPDAKEKP